MRLHPHDAAARRPAFVAQRAIRGVAGTGAAAAPHPPLRTTASSNRAREKPWSPPMRWRSIRRLEGRRGGSGGKGRGRGLGERVGLTHKTSDRGMRGCIVCCYSSRNACVLLCVRPAALSLFISIISHLPLHQSSRTSSSFFVNHPALTASTRMTCRSAMTTGKRMPKRLSLSATSAARQPT